MTLNPWGLCVLVVEKRLPFIDGFFVSSGPYRYITKDLGGLWNGTACTPEEQRVARERDVFDMIVLDR